IKNYPNGKWNRRAVNILYGLQQTEGSEIFDQSWLTDSLQKVKTLNQFYWVPVFKSGLYGFMDEQGTEIMAPRFESIGDEYNCGNITDPFVVTSTGLIGRDGTVLCKGNVNEARDLGLGFIEVAQDSGRFVIHESGFNIEKSKVEASRTVANRFIGLQRNKKWAIYSLAGKSITSFTFDHLDSFDSLIVLEQAGKKILTTPYRLVRDIERPGAKETFVFDDIKRWGGQQYWVRNGLLEGVIDVNLNFVIPLDRQLLRKTTFGFLREKEKRLFIQGIPRYENKSYLSVYEQANWVRMQMPAGGYILYEKTFGHAVEGDSAWFQHQIAFMVSGDSVNAYLPSGQKLSFYASSVFRLIESKDSAAWMILDEKKRKTVYDAASGVRLFSSEFDQIEPVSSKVFLITKAGKKGLVGEDGRILVPIEYDAIVSTGDHTFSLLKEKKFGWYDARTRQLMKPVYDRNVRLYNDRYQLAFKDKGYGFIRPDGTPLGNFEWEDFQFWNDSTAWVKKNFQWLLLSIQDQRVKLDRVRNFSTILDTPAEKICSLRQDNATGIISNRRGIVIPIKYSDIINLGTAEDPLYFTERHIEEAAISVVVYYDKQGKIIRRQAMETDEFEKIVCDN
ncbi:MAG TPA: WG repeat-containing protein, partial [Cyclobacteriaceae bacterium]|nr:WG repeat-containing protein [Cyclobacteriaceae bacterium]